MTDCFLFTYSYQKNQVWVHDRDTFSTLFSCFVLCGNAIKSWKNSRKTWYLHKNHEILEKKKKSQTFETLWTIGDALTVKNQLFGNVQKKNISIFGSRPNWQKIQRWSSPKCVTFFKKWKRNITFQCVQSCKKVLWKVCVLMYQLQIGSPCWEEWVVVGQLFLSYLSKN